jgi:hypothetical protein
MGYKEVLLEHQRLSVLRLLAEAGGYSLNTSVIQDALDSLGLEASRDQVATICSWLAEQGLVRIEDVGAVTVVHGTARGLDVAAGKALQPGVKRPSPEA